VSGFQFQEMIKLQKHEGDNILLNIKINSLGIWYRNGGVLYLQW